MLIKKLTAYRNLFSQNLNEPDGDGDYFDAKSWEYLFSIWGNKRSDIEDIRPYRAHFLRREYEMIKKRWHELHVDYNEAGVGIQVAPGLWENTFVLPDEQPDGFGGCTPGCNHCCCFNFGRIIIHQGEFGALPRRKFHPFDDRCPWACRGGCSVYGRRPFICKLWHCQEIELGGEKAYKEYLARCHRDGAVVINSAVRGLGCSENGSYGKNWRLL